MEASDPSSGNVDHSAHHAQVEYAETIAGETLEYAKASYDLTHERVYKLVTLVVGGAGAAGVYGVGKLGSSADSLALSISLISLAAWWFCIAAVLLMRGATSREMKVGTNSAGIRSRLYKHQQAMEGEGADERALIETRWDQLAAVDKQIDSYSAGATLRSLALDSAYRWLVCSPIPIFAGYLIAQRLK